MNKIFKYISLALVASTLFLSCSADSSQGMLRLIIESEAKTSYTINKSSFSSNSSSTLGFSYFVSAENDGIYKESAGTGGKVERIKYANSEDLRNVQSIYTDGYTTYVIYTKVDKTVDPYTTTPTLISFKNNEEPPTYLPVTDTYLPVTESITGTPINLTSNGYLITEDAQNYNIYKLNDTGVTILSNTLSLPIGETYTDYAVLGTDKLVITTSDNYYYYDDDDGTATSLNKFTINTTADDNHSTIVAVSEILGDYLVLTADGYTYSGDITTNIALTENVSNSSTNDTFAPHVPTITIGNYLLAMDNTDYIYVYDKTNKTRYNSSNDIVMSYASDLNSSSPIIYIEEITTTSGILNIHTYWIATQYNGFYTITIDKNKVTSTSSGNTSSKGLVPEVT